MAEYDRSNIRNIALIAPHGAGKTSLAEAMLFMHGATDKLGRVDDGSSILDYESEEKNRNMSINSHIAFFETKNNLINVVDTPGFLNFLYLDSDTILTNINLGQVEMGTEFKKVSKKFDVSMKDILDIQPDQEMIP